MPGRVFRLRIARLAVLSLLVGLLLRPAETRAQVEIEPTAQFELTEVLTVGDGEDAPVESFFSNPQYVRTDADARIYVVDGRSVGRASGSRVRVFGPKGDFLDVLGRPGGGPGEFADIQGLALDAKNQVVVYDRGHDRFTRFAPFDEIESFPIPEEEHRTTVRNPEASRFTPSLMHVLPDGHLVLFHHPPPAERTPTSPRLHIYNDRFENVESFGAPTDWSLPDDEFTRHLVKRATPFGASHVAPGTPSLVLAPTLYRGVLFRYTRGPEGTWTLHRLEGRNPGHATHELVESPREPFSLFTSDGIGARYRSATKGVGQLSDGRIVHLSVSEDDEGIRQLQLELFAEDGTLRKVGRIGTFLHDETGFDDVNEAVRVSLKWIDRNDRLYLLDARDDPPVIQVMELDE